MPTSPYSYAQRLLSDADLAFVADDPSMHTGALDDLRRQLATDEHARADALGGDRLFRRVLNLDEAFVRISPRLFFEVLLRRSIHDIATAPHVLERAGSDRVPLFLGDKEVRTVSGPAVIDYLADMLVSFTKINSQTARVRVRRGVWRKSRYSDLDVPSLLRLASEVGDTERRRIYKRAADASLLILGVFPDFATTAYATPVPVPSGVVAHASPPRNTSTSPLAPTNSLPSIPGPTPHTLNPCARSASMSSMPSDR